MSEANNNQKQKLKKYAVFAGMFIAFAICMWLIFAPSEADKEKGQQGAGFNSDIPDPKKGELISDKRDAYQKEQMDQKQKERMRSLETFMLDTGSDEDTAEGGKAPSVQVAQRPAQSKTSGRIQQSSSAYQDINRTLGNFYEKPVHDPEKEEMKKKLQELEDKFADKQNKQSAIEEQVALMEKSYELAAKYMPQTAGNVQYPNEADREENPPEGLSAQQMRDKFVKASGNGNQKAKVSPVRQIQDRTISALRQTYSNDELMALYDRPRNFGFNTLSGEGAKTGRNTVKACIHGDQSVMNGQSVFVRLLEAVTVDDATIPVHTIITAHANLQGERLELQISSIEHGGVIYPVKMSVYDTDGTRGVYVPASMELDALKEIAANMGSSVGQSFTMTQSAGAQIASDLTKGTIQGVSQLFAKKIRMVKINLKAGHKVLLYPEKQ